AQVGVIAPLGDFLKRVPRGLPLSRREGRYALLQIRVGIARHHVILLRLILAPRRIGIAGGSDACSEPRPAARSTGKSLPAIRSNFLKIPLIQSSITIRTRESRGRSRFMTASAWHTPRPRSASR